MEDFIVFDLETQRSAAEVGGWQNIAEMKMSVGVLWHSRINAFRVYYEDEIQELISDLKSGPLVIGYNHIGFDYTVLSGYYPAGAERANALTEFKKLKNLDLLVDLKNAIGKRVKLDAVARPTLNVGKSADGLLALQWYKEYLDGASEKLKMIADYCEQDVAVTRDVYLHGLTHGKLSYIDKSLGLKQVDIQWSHHSPKAPENKAVQLSF